MPWRSHDNWSEAGTEAEACIKRWGSWTSGEKEARLFNELSSISKNGLGNLATNWWKAELISHLSLIRERGEKLGGRKGMSSKICFVSQFYHFWWYNLIQSNIGQLGEMNTMKRTFWFCTFAWYNWSHMMNQCSSKVLTTKSWHKNISKNSKYFFLIRDILTCRYELYQMVNNTCGSCLRLYWMSDRLNSTAHTPDDAGISDTSVSPQCL